MGWHFIFWDCLSLELWQICFGHRKRSGDWKQNGRSNGRFQQQEMPSVLRRKAEAVRVGSESGAVVTAREFVSRRLKAPSTAKFSGEQGIRYGDAWLVRGFVDSQNSFGVMIRARYLCRVQHVGNNKWHLQESCKIISR